VRCRGADSGGAASDNDDFPCKTVDDFLPRRLFPVCGCQTQAHARLQLIWNIVPLGKRFFPAAIKSGLPQCSRPAIYRLVAFLWLIL